MHTTCIDWAFKPFPLTSEVNRLRQQWRALRAATLAVEAAGQWLAELKKRWPRGGAESMLEWERMKRQLQDLIRRVGE
jgi:hypothetical protein